MTAGEMSGGASPPDPGIGVGSADRGPHPEDLSHWEGAPVEEWRQRWGAPALRILASTGSTNDVARDMARRGAPAGTMVIAEAQTAGRGRGGRAWLAPAGAGLLLSWIVRPAAEERRASVTPIRVGLEVAESIQAATGLTALVKWPNDVLASNGRKLAGILCEATHADEGPRHLVVGIGINVRQAPEEFPPALRSGATSLAAELGAPPDRAALTGEIVRRLIRLQDRVGRDLDDAEVSRLAGRDYLLGRVVTVDGRHAGVAAGIEASGRLLIRGSSGDQTALGTGMVRPVERSGSRTRTRGRT